MRAIASSASSAQIEHAITRNSAQIENAITRNSVQNEQNSVQRNSDLKEYFKYVLFVELGPMVFIVYGLIKVYGKLQQVDDVEYTDTAAFRGKQHHVYCSFQR